MFLHRNDQKMITFSYFGPRILFVRPERTVGNNGLIEIFLSAKFQSCEHINLIELFPDFVVQSGISNEPFGMLYSELGLFVVMCW